MPDEEKPQEALPGVAGMAQGQQGAAEQPVAPAEQPEQPDKLVTGAEALEEQQKNPELKDNSGTRP